MDGVTSHLKIQFCNIKAFSRDLSIFGEVYVHFWRGGGNRQEVLEINPFVLNVKKPVKAFFLGVLVLLVCT